MVELSVLVSHGGGSGGDSGSAAAAAAVVIDVVKFRVGIINYLEAVPSK